MNQCSISMTSKAAYSYFCFHCFHERMATCRLQFILFQMQMKRSKLHIYTYNLAIKCISLSFSIISFTHDKMLCMVIICLENTVKIILHLNNNDSQKAR